MLWTLIIGAIAGWAAGQLTRGQGFGLVTDIIVGVVGAYIGRFALSFFGFATYGLIAEIITSTIGAVILLAIIRMFSGRSTA